MRKPKIENILITSSLNAIIYFGIIEFTIGFSLNLTGNRVLLNTEYPEMIQETIGNDVKLHCGLKEPSNEIDGTTINWYFMQCGQNYNKSSCQYYYNDYWTQLFCANSKCESNLVIKNISEENSGLYKCTIFPYKPNAFTTLQIQIVRTYQLDVKDTTISLPTIFNDFPKNLTSKIGQQVVLQCKVYSRVRPTVKWFKRIYGEVNSIENYHHHYSLESFTNSRIQYSGSTYELLKSAREKSVKNNIYLSKLIINNVDSDTEGYYACVAINYRGHILREVYLKIFGENSWHNDDHRNSLKYFLLFLIPTLIPIFLWLYFISKKKRFARATTQFVTSDDERALKTYAI